MSLFAKLIAAGIGMALAPAALAQAPKPAAPAPAPQPTVSIPGVSPAGNAALTRIARTEDPAQKDAVTKLRAIEPQIAATVNAQPFDVEKFAGLMRQVARYQAVIGARVTERMIESVKALPATDRAPFLKAISTQRAPAQPGR